VLGFGDTGRTQKSLDRIIAQVDTMPYPDMVKFTVVMPACAACKLNVQLMGMAMNLHAGQRQHHNTVSILTFACTTLFLLLQHG